MTDRSGRCLCGQVTFRIGAEPVISRICWCRDCQHLAGNGTVNAIFPSDAIQVSGDTAAYTSAADRPATATRPTSQFLFIMFQSLCKMENPRHP